MEQPVSFDAEDFIRKLREAQASSLAWARKNVSDPTTLAGIEAQAAYLPARECWVRLHIGLREAGRDQNFIAAVAGSLAGMILDDVLLNSADAVEAKAVFIHNMARAVSGEHRITQVDLFTPARPAGRA